MGDKNKWPHGAKAAIALTLDNCGEAADLNRGLLPKDAPIGSHYSITEVLPQILALLEKYNIKVTYFIESWSLVHYGEVIANDVAGNGHEVAWHAWQHEAWSRLSPSEEDENFKRSFGDEGIGGFISKGPGKGKVQSYRGFRPPGGIIHGNQTLSKCLDYGLRYISPAAEHAAVISVDRDGTSDSITILPFRWTSVDATYYMDAFSGLRKLKGLGSGGTLSEDVLVESYINAIDETIRKGGFLSLLFHPFLTNTTQRLEAMERVVQHLARKRDNGEVWLAPCKGIEEYVRNNPNSVAKDPEWDTSSWR